MRHRLNYRFALWFAAAVAVLGAGTHFLHAYQVQRNASALLERARRAEGRGETFKAADYLTRYLGLRPNDVDALVEYGRLLADGEQDKSPSARLRALLTLEKVLYRDPQRHEVRRRVVQLAIGLGRHARARDDIKTYLLPAFPGDAELEHLLGVCFEAIGDFREARAWYERSAGHGPKDLQTHMRLAALLRRHPQEVLRDKETPASLKQSADAAINQMVRANADSYQAYLVRADYSRSVSATPVAPEVLATVARDIARARELAPDAEEVLLAAADLAQTRGDSGEARDLLRHGCEKHAKDWRLFTALARLEGGANRTEAAVECLRRGLENRPDQPDLLWDLANLLIAMGRRDEAQGAIDRLGRVGLPAADRDLLTARLLAREERWPEAIAKLEGAYSALVDRANQLNDLMAGQLSEQAGLLLARGYEQIGDAGRAHDAYSRVVARNVQSVAGRLGLATVRWAQGRLTEALDQYRQLLRLPGAPASAMADVARLVLLVNLEREEPQRDWRQVEEALDAAERAQPSSPAIALLRAESWAARRQFDRARQTLLERYAEPKARPVEVWAGLAALESRQGRADAVLAVLEEAQRHCGDHIELRLARARHCLQFGREQARATLPALAEGLDQFPIADRRRLLQGLGGAFVQVGLTAEAKGLWESSAQEQTGNLRSRLVLFDLAALANDEPAMAHWLNEIRRIEGEDGVLGRHARVTALIARAERGDIGGLGEARRLLAAVAARRPDWSRVPLCEARIADLEQCFDAALTSYLRAIQLGERDPLAIGRAIVLLSSRGRDAEANRIARSVSDPALLPHETQSAAAEVALRAHDGQRAMQLAEASAAKDANDYRGQLLLGRACWAAGQPERAEPALIRARELAPAVPVTWETLIQFLVANGQTDKARAEVESARSRLTDSLPAQLALARCHEQVGQADEARRIYEKALESAGEDAEILSNAAHFYLRTARFAEAQDLLLRLSRNANGPAAAWATRTRLFLMALDPSHGNPKETLAQLDAFERTRPAENDTDTINNQRTRACLLALQSSRERRREAVKILEGLIRKQAATPLDHLLAAQLYEAIGDWPNARARYLGLLNLPGADGSLVLTAVARSLLRHGEPDGAEQALRVLERQAPREPGTMEIRARLMHLQNRTAEAVALLRESSRSEGADRRALASILEEMEHHSEAETLSRSIAAQTGRPEDGMALANFLVRRRRFDEALEICDRWWAKTKPAVVAETCLAALAEAPPDSPQLRRVSDRIEEILRRTPDDADLHATLACVRNFQGRFADAEELYRRALARNPKHVMALNNLAWLLALHGDHGDEALTLVNRATELVGPEPSLLDTRAVAYMALKRRDAAELAVRDLESVAAESPSATTNFHLARALALAGRREDARRAWEGAIKLGLRSERLHTLERPAFQQFEREFR